MGLSHFAIANALPDAGVVAICDTSRYVLSMLRKHTGVQTYTDVGEMIREAGLDCLFVATPTSTHFECARTALEHDLHLFVEKPLTLSPAQSEQLASLAAQRKRINMVGFHNRFIATFREARRLVRGGALGEITAVNGSAFGPVVLKERGSTWRSRKAEGGGCLHDYACHVVDLLNFLLGKPQRVLSGQMRSIYSRDVEDAVSAVIDYGHAKAQVETNWSDDTVRKMTTTVSVKGDRGELLVDRQELRIDLLSGPHGAYPPGRTTRHITDLQEPVPFYLRGEEYSAQVYSFFDAIRSGTLEHENSFASACDTDRVLDSIARASDATRSAS